MVMKNSRYLLTMIALAVVAAFSSCKADEAKSPAESTVPVMSKVMATADEPDKYAQTAGAPAETKAEAPAVTTSGSAPETKAETSFTGFKDIHAVTPEELDALYADNGWDESTVIHLPVQTVSADFVPQEETPDVTAGDKVFLVSVDADTTDEMMREVIDRYSLEVIYDYESFNMYAVAVPEPLDAQQSKQFINELSDNYSFILSVEPDSVVTLDGGSSAATDMLY